MKIGDPTRRLLTPWLKDCFMLIRTILLTAFTLTLAPVTADVEKVLLNDDFNREESSPEKEEIGNGWSTNSRTRAKGQKQVDLVDGTLHITRAAVADHGVSVVHDVAFRDAEISLRFKIGAKDDLGINIADMNEKSVHAGHICVARVRPNGVEISDLKTGNMKLEHRAARKANQVSTDLSALLKTKKKIFPHQLGLNVWHTLRVRIHGNEMSVDIDGKRVGVFQSEGIAHETKSRLRLAVNRTAWVDDVRIVGK